MGRKGINSESKVIRHYLGMAVHRRLIGRMEYAASVAEHFMATVPVSERRTTKASGRGKMRLDFHVPLASDCVDTVVDKRKANARKIITYLDHEGHMVADMRRSFIFCLPSPLNLECRRELYRDEGFLCVPMLSGQRQDPGVLYEEFADVTRAEGVLRAGDGQINEFDDPEALRAYVSELDDLVEVLLANKALAEAAIGKQIAGNVARIKEVV